MIRSLKASLSPPVSDGQSAPRVPPMPGVVHQMWLPNWRQSPRAVRHTRAEWARLNPEWEVRFWSQVEVEELLCSHYAEFLPLWERLARERVIKRCDLARLLVLHRCGGLYADMDLLPTAPLTVNEGWTGRLLTGAEYTVDGEPQRICNGFLGCQGGEDFWLEMIREAAPRAHGPVLSFLGPRALSRWLLPRDPVVVPWRLFLSRDPEPGALTRNLDSRSWGDGGTNWYEC